MSSLIKMHTPRVANAEPIPNIVEFRLRQDGHEVILEDDHGYHVLVLSPNDKTGKLQVQLCDLVGCRDDVYEIQKRGIKVCPILAF